MILTADVFLDLTYVVMQEAGARYTHRSCTVYLQTENTTHINNNNNIMKPPTSILGDPSSEAQQNKIVNQIQEPYRSHHQFEGPPNI